MADTERVEPDETLEAARAGVLAWRNLDDDARAALESNDVESLRLLALDLLAARRAVHGGRCQGCDERIDVGQRYEQPFPVYPLDCCLTCAEACYATGHEPNTSDRTNPWYKARFGGYL